MVTASRLLGSLCKLAVALVVLAFMGVQSIDFFQFVFRSDQQWMAWLGFGLTGGGLIAYLLYLRFAAESEMDKMISVVMIFVCAIGELAAAGFGMQVAAWQQAGFVITEEVLLAMINGIRVLAFIHAVALIFSFAGDRVLEVLGLPIPGAKQTQNFTPAPEHR